MSVVSADRRDRSTLSRDLGLVAWQVRYEQRAYWRNRGRGFFTFAFPLMFLVIFGSIDKGAMIGHGPHAIGYDDFFVPGILAYAVIATTYVNLALSTAILRDQGVLKRMQGTPLPRPAYVAARILSTVLIMLAITVVTLVLGVVAYGIQVRVATLPGVIITLILGTAAFSTLGMGITRFIPNAEAAPVVINLTVLPLTFLSGVWFPVTHLPNWLNDIAKIFPIRPLANGLQTAFNPYSKAPAIVGTDVLTLLIWTVIGVYLMLRFLRQPQREPAMSRFRFWRVLFWTGGPWAERPPFQRAAMRTVWIAFVVFPVVDAALTRGPALQKAAVILAAGLFVAGYVLMIGWQRTGGDRRAAATLVVMLLLATFLTLVQDPGWGFLFIYCSACAGLLRGSRLGFAALATCTAFAAVVPALSGQLGLGRLDRLRHERGRRRPADVAGPGPAHAQRGTG